MTAEWSSWRAVTLRYGHAAVDHGAVSFVHFAVTILAARWLTPGEFGLFSILFTVYLLVCELYNSSVLQRIPSLMTTFVGNTAPYVGGMIKAHTRALLLSGVLVALALGLTGLDRRLFVCALLIPLCCAATFFHFVRRVSYFLCETRDLAKAAFVYAFFSLTGLMVLHRLQALSTASLFLALTFAGLLSALLTLRTAWTPPYLWSRALRLRQLAKLHRSHAHWGLLASFLMWGFGPLQILLLAGIDGLTSAATFRTALTLFMPVGQLMLAVMAVKVPQLAQLLAVRDFHGARRCITHLTVALGLLGMSNSIVLFLFSKEIYKLIYPAFFLQGPGVTRVLALALIPSGFFAATQAVFQAVGAFRTFTILLVFAAALTIAAFSIPAGTILMRAPVSLGVAYSTAFLLSRLQPFRVVPQVSR